MSVKLKILGPTPSSQNHQTLIIPRVDSGPHQSRRWERQDRQFLVSPTDRPLGITSSRAVTDVIVFKISPNDASRSLIATN
ncbi:hypothetical protein [Magnetospirillum fulvum]|uniref:hypothetical protein n=1 Tax=Magnetospirillum fulvum TaxID=1082 RepID=UPI001B8AECB3|nr:hypothetical protein [Magnetospirillum fulvum]